MKKSLLLLLCSACSAICTAQVSQTSVNDDLPIKKLKTADEQFAGYYSNGTKQYEGYKRKSNLHGPWMSWYDGSQMLDTGYLIKGIPDGQWMGWYKNGKPRFIRTYSASKWQQYHLEKSRYHPKRIVLPITQLYHENKQRAAIYTTAIYSFCSKKDCTRDNETLQQMINNNNEQEHYHPLFDDGLLHGVFVNYFSDGSIKDTGNYKNGLPEGLWINWTDDKQFYWKGYYQHGLKDKEWKLYAANGKLIRLVAWREGKLLWKKNMKEGVEVVEIE